MPHTKCLPSPSLELLEDDRVVIDTGKWLW